MITFDGGAVVEDFDIGPGLRCSLGFFVGKSFACSKELGMRRWLLAVFCCVFGLMSVANAQNWNTWKLGTQASSYNQLMWSEADARAFWQPYLASGWPYGVPTCVPIGWRELPENATHGVHQYTRYMIGETSCADSSGHASLYTVATYEVYTCDNNSVWSYYKPSGEWFCREGYYLTLAGSEADKGQCQCEQGRAATKYPIEMGSGNMSESAVDFVGGDGGLTYTRYYNSNPLAPDLGRYGWQNEYASRHIYPLNRSLKSSLPKATFRASSTSSVYGSAEEACVQGVSDIVQGIGGSAPNPNFAGVAATYAGSGKCQLSNGAVVSVLNTLGALAYSKPMGDAAIAFSVFRPDGRYYHFVCYNGACSSTGQSAISLAATSAGFTLTAENGDVESYDVNGNLLQIVRRDGYTRTVTTTFGPKSDMGQVSSVTDSYGRVLSFSYSTAGLLDQLTLPDQTTVHYAYDSIGRLSSVTYADGKSVGYKYEATGFPQALTAWVDEANSTYATWTYDSTTGMATGSALNGNVDTSTLSYSGDVTTVTDNLGAQRTYNYQSIAGGRRLMSVIGPACKECMGQSMTYDANGFLKTAKDWNDVTTSYVFNAQGLLQQRVEGVGTATQRTASIGWNAALRVPLARTLSDAGGTVVSSTSWVYNAAGWALARCDIDASTAASYTCAVTGAVPAGVRRWTYTYCDAVDGTQCPRIGLLLSITGPRTDLTSTAHYSYYLSTDESGCGTAGGACHRAGDLYQVTNAIGQVTTMVAYDKNGRVVRQRDANGVLTDSTYTARGWLSTRTVRANADGSTSPNDAVTQIGYTPYGAVASIKDPDGVQVTYTYDAAHRLTDITDALGNRIHYTLDAAGNKTKEETFDASNTLRRSLARSYNTLGQLTGIKDGLNRTVFDASFSDSYDGNGNLARSADALGIQRKQGYDALNRLVSTIDNYNGTDTATQNTQSVFAYGPRDELQGVSDPDSLNTTYDYDGLGNATGLHSPDTGTSIYVYDAAGNRIQATDARGVVSHSTYDALNRITGTTYPTSSANVSYRYDEADSVTGCTGSYPSGRLTRMVETAVTTVYCYDLRGNVVQKRQAQGTNVDTVSYTYTLADRLASTRTPDGTFIQYGRDSLGRIDVVTAQLPGAGSAGNVVTNVSYLPFGPIASYTLGNGQTITRSYDANYAVTDVVSPALNLHFARDAMGNITALGNAPGANPAIETYSYDPLYRLLGLKDAQGQAMETYTYNKTGDRLSKASNGLATGAYGYQAGTHRLTSIGSSARTYDANGNTTGNGTGGDTFGYGYNDRNRMTVTQRNGQTIASYIYNAVGERVGKSSATSQRFAYDEGSQLLGEYGVASRSYIWLGSMPLAVVDTVGGTSTLGFVHADGLGTPRVVTDGAGAAIWQWSYQANPFGEKVPKANGQAINLRFPGQYLDVENGLMYNVSRNFEAQTGRYVQSDPLGLFGGQVSTYAYVGADPINSSDPLGLGPWDNYYGLPKDFWNWLHKEDGGRLMKSLKDPKTGQIPRDAAMDEYERWKNLQKSGLQKSGLSGLAKTCAMRVSIVAWSIFSPMNSGQCEDPCDCGEVCGPERRRQLSTDLPKVEPNYIKGGR
ncbi:RHS repeat-associated core domain-containing protein [Dyella sp.]|uniref:RHS repeat-associated core domain-containing protein n=1 Tax=Dyella sp. TaxID=1869338 RepID=UPI0032162F31